MNQRALTFTAVAFFASVILFSQAGFATYSGGSGTTGDPYQISSADDLLALSADTNNYGRHFILTADINLTGRTFTTAVIAYDTNNKYGDFQGTFFTGVFDGNSHTISNLTINTNGIRNNFLGLFGSSLSATIKNIHLTNVNIITDTNSIFIGALSGYDDGSTVSNCSSAGNVTGGNGSTCLGGLLGFHDDGAVSNCYSTCTVAGRYGSSVLGGLMGANLFGEISGCCSTGDIISGDASSQLGGLVGYNESDGNIINCYATGNIGSGNYSSQLGGLVGYNSGNNNIIKCYSTGVVIGGDSFYQHGGLVGQADSNTIIKSSYFLDTSGPENGYGTPLSNTLMKQQASFIGWDFASIWEIAEGDSYPVFVGQSDCNVPSTPKNVAASDGTYADHISITWDSVSDASTYTIWRGTSNDPNLASMLGDYNSPFDDYDVTIAANYYYWVQAKNACWRSNFSVSDYGVACVVPAAPATVSATGGTDVNKVRITWDSVSGATTYQVWRSTINNSSSAVMLAYSASPFDDNTVTPGMAYYYWIKAGVNCGISDFSSSCLGYACSVLSAPEVLASDGTYTDHINVTWSAVDHATAYELWRSASSVLDSASELGEYDSPVDDYDVIPGTNYYYWVRAKDFCSTGEFSSANYGYASTDTSTYSLTVTKCTIKAGSKLHHDKISFSGTMNPTSDDLFFTNYIQLLIGADYMSAPCAVLIPIDSNSYMKTGKFRYSGTDSDGVKKSFKLNLKTHEFSLAASNIDLSGLSSPVNIQGIITNFNANTTIGETIVNGSKQISINLMMGAKDLLIANKTKVKYGSEPSSDSMTISGIFTAKNSDMNMAGEDFSVTFGSQTFMIPANSLKPDKTQVKFTCLNAALSEGSGVASAVFDFNKRAFSLTIKKISIKANPYEMVTFAIKSDDFNASTTVQIP